MRSARTILGRKGRVAGNTLALILFTRSGLASAGRLRVLSPVKTRVRIMGRQEA
jgi:hypothetical protein